MADAGRPLQIFSDASNPRSQQHPPEDAVRLLAQRQQWAREMRLKFSPRDMIFEDGALNPEYVLAMLQLFHRPILPHYGHQSLLNSVERR